LRKIIKLLITQQPLSQPQKYAQIFYPYTFKKFLMHVGLKLKATKFYFIKFSKDNQAIYFVKYHHRHFNLKATVSRFGACCSLTQKTPFSLERKLEQIQIRVFGTFETVSNIASQRTVKTMIFCKRKTQCF